MSNVRIGIVGMGNMGTAHANSILAGKIPRLTLAAIAEPDAARRSCSRLTMSSITAGFSGAFISVRL